MSKYKYYFRKPKSEIVKDFFNVLLVAGVITVAATSPYFINNFLKANAHFKKYKKQRVSDVFARLKRQGLLDIVRNNGQIYIRLTEEGKKKANLYQIDSLSIKKPKKWDKKWRIVIFDIAELKRTHREAFRGKLKELGFASLQKSVWVNPFKCQDEIALLRDFFGLNEKDVRIIVAEDVEQGDELKRHFRLT